MAFDTTVDTRPHTIGNLLMVTGTFTNSGGSTNQGRDIDLSAYFSKVVACGVNASRTTPGSGGGVDGAFITISSPASTISINCVAGQDGTYWAMGLRN